MMHGYFKMDNVSCRIVSDTSLFMCKIRVLAVSMACPCRVHAVSGHHSPWDSFFSPLGWSMSPLDWDIFASKVNLWVTFGFLVDAQFLHFCKFPGFYGFWVLGPQSIWCSDCINWDCFTFSSWWFLTLRPKRVMAVLE